MELSNLNFTTLSVIVTAVGAMTFATVAKYVVTYLLDSAFHKKVDPLERRDVSFVDKETCRIEKSGKVSEKDCRSVRDQCSNNIQEITERIIENKHELDLYRKDQEAAMSKLQDEQKRTQTSVEEIGKNVNQLQEGFSGLSQKVEDQGKSLDQIVELLKTAIKKS